MDLPVLNFRRYSPAVLTLLVFLLAQGIGSIVLLGIGILVSPEFGDACREYYAGTASGLPVFQLLPVSLIALVVMATDIIAVLVCRSLLHFSLRRTLDISAIRWRPGMLAVAGGIFGALGMSILTDSVEVPDSIMQMSLAMSHSAVGMLVVVVVGPIAEELLFREAIAGEMMRRGANPWAAILVSALAFSIVHLNFAQGIYALPLGILFGIIYVRTRSIVLTAILHIVNNGIVVILLYALGEDMTQATYGEWFGGMAIPYVVMLVCFVLCIILIRWFLRAYSPSPRYPLDDILLEEKDKM